MPYSAEIRRDNPTCVLFLIDQSGSMIKPFGQGSGRTKAQDVADAINRIVQTLVFRCTKGIDVYYDYYYVGVIGYGARVGSGLGGKLAGEGLVPISAIAANPLRVETRAKKVPDGAGGLVEQTAKVPVWFEAMAEGKTPMCEALGQARTTVEDFVRNCPACFPPTVINITDGEATDANPEALAAEVRNIASEDGNVLLFNAHISSSNAVPVQFPAAESELPDNNFARMLFRMSSPFPESMLLQARGMELPVAAGARGFVFNADLVSVVEFLNIGTRPNPNMA
jgi:hypothetical protein